MKKPIIQKHHLVYENEEHKQKEIVEPIFKGEHWLITHLNRRKNISKGFVKHMKMWLALHEDEARDLKLIMDAKESI